MTNQCGYFDATNDQGVSLSCQLAAGHLGGHRFPLMLGRKGDAGKLDWTLLPFSALVPVVRVLMAGEKEYGRDNWQRVEPTERYSRALFRHAMAYGTGEMIDPKSGESHLAHVVCNALFLLWFAGRGK